MFGRCGRTSCSLSPPANHLHVATPTNQAALSTDWRAWPAGLLSRLNKKLLMLRRSTAAALHHPDVSVRRSHIWRPSWPGRFPACLGLQRCECVSMCVWGCLCTFHFKQISILVPARIMGATHSDGRPVALQQHIPHQE